MGAASVVGSNQEQNSGPLAILPWRGEADSRVY